MSPEVQSKRSCERVLISAKDVLKCLAAPESLWLLGQYGEVTILRGSEEKVYEVANAILGLINSNGLFSCGELNGVEMYTWTGRDHSGNRYMVFINLRGDTSLQDISIFSPDIHLAYYSPGLEKKEITAVGEEGAWRQLELSFPYRALLGLDGRMRQMNTYLHHTERLRRWGKDGLRRRALLDVLLQQLKREANFLIQTASGGF